MARRGIVDAAFALFSTHGFDDTTVEMIAERALVAPRTVYRYFDSKESIVFAGFDGEADWLITMVRKHCADGVSIRALFDAFAEQLDRRQHQPGFPTLTGLMRDNTPLMTRGDAWRRGVMNRVAETLADLRGETEPTFEDKTLAAAVVAGSATAVAQWAADDHRDDLGELVRRAGQMIIEAREG